MKNTPCRGFWWSSGWDSQNKGCGFHACSENQDPARREGNGQKIRRIIIKNLKPKNQYIYIPCPSAFSLGHSVLESSCYSIESLNRSVQRDQMERPCRGAVNSWLRCPLRTRINRKYVRVDLQVISAPSHLVAPNLQFLVTAQTLGNRDKHAVW